VILLRAGNDLGGRSRAVVDQNDELVVDHENIARARRRIKALEAVHDIDNTVAPQLGRYQIPNAPAPAPADVATAPMRLLRVAVTCGRQASAWRGGHRPTADKR
jgi:hypothetical protein